jgi:hypothetical protein
LSGAHVRAIKEKEKITGTRKVAETAKTPFEKIDSEKPNNLAKQIESALIKAAENKKKKMLCHILQNDNEEPLIVDGKPILYKIHLDLLGQRSNNNDHPTDILNPIYMSTNTHVSKLEDDNNFIADDNTFQCIEEGCKKRHFDNVEEAREHHSKVHNSKLKNPYFLFLFSFFLKKI